MSNSNIDQNELEIKWLRGEIPTHIYCQFNNKPAWYNAEIQKQEFYKEIENRRQSELEKQQAKAEEKAMIEEAQKQIEKQLPSVLDKAMKDILQSFK